MKRIYLFVLPILGLLLSVAGCIQNGGNIGVLFGRWHLESIDAENMSAPVSRGEIFWAFQKDMIQMQRDNGSHSVSKTYGLYRIEDDMLYLNFPDENEPPFTETGLKRQSALQILKMTKREMVLRYQVDSDSSLTYCLKKW